MEEPPKYAKILILIGASLVIAVVIGLMVALEVVQT